MQPGKRPLSFLLPTVVRPAEGLCGTYLALGANGAARGLSGLTQVRFPLCGQEPCYDLGCRCPPVSGLSSSLTHAANMSQDCFVPGPS